MIYEKLGRLAILALPIVAMAAAPARAADLPITVPLPSTLTAPGAPWATVWSGLALSSGYRGLYVGGVWSPNRNIWAEGFLVRAEGNVGHYKYNSVGFTNIEVQADGAALLGGYRKSIGQSWLTGYLGVNYETHHNPDPAAVVNGTRTGLKLIGEYYSPITAQWNLIFYGAYSTAFDSFYTLLRTTYKIAPKIEVGPEGAYLGSIGFRQWRAGAATRFETAFGEIIFSGGYFENISSSLGSDKSGFYANLHFSLLLR